MSGFNSPEEFDAWKLAWELKEKVHAFTDRPPASRDGKFCEEIREAARSAPDNISEGFYRFSPPDFANFVRVARGSLGEVRNQLLHAHARKYLMTRSSASCLACAAAQWAHVADSGCTC